MDLTSSDTNQDMQSSLTTNRDGLTGTPPGGTPSNFLRTNGGIMRRFLTAFILLIIGLAGLTDAVHAQYIKHVSGYLPAGQTNVFFPRTPNNSLTDTLYKIDGDYHVAGTLIVQAG